MSQPLDFIDLVEPSTGRTSSLAIYGKRKDSDKLRITGGLEHGDKMIPKTVQDADKLINWLLEWKKTQNS